MMRSERAAQVHTGDGIARREAYHERRVSERAMLEEVNVEGLLAAEQQRAGVIVRVGGGCRDNPLVE